ncbi:MAG: DoxX family membrane protein [Bacteroidetes bacterium]|nr:DoxX family membrane protein [Bacteroidota bacterium]MBS1931751.1 DoxX family membrane protein [Bacteroidota bacterium]
MKLITTIVRIIVAVLFIFSGLIKANDPLGLSYKMQEFFEAWNDSLSKGSFFLNHTLINFFDFLHQHSLTLAVIMIAFEIIAGAALLLGWQMRFFSRFLLLLILFFTFLTGYALLSGKFKNCGCFGDCIPITPKTSFLKDIVLTVLIFFLFWQRKKIQPFFTRKTGLIAMVLVTVFSFGVQWYMLTYLPVWDCLPFKVGNNISEQMKIPADAVPDSTVITFVYNRQGKEVEFTSDNFPPDFNDSLYKFVNRHDKLIRKGKNNEPPIKGFVLSGVTNVDSTQIVLSQPYAVLLFCMDFSEPVSRWERDFAKLYGEAKNKNIPVYVVTSRMDQATATFAGTSLATIPIFKCDYTAIRTAARTNPCLYLLKQGTILGKWSYKQINSAIKKLP